MGKKDGAVKRSGRLHARGYGPRVGGWSEECRRTRDPAATVAARCEDASVAEQDRDHAGPASNGQVARQCPTIGRRVVDFRRRVRTARRKRWGATNHEDAPVE